jgi:ankyrin repeat protein
MSAKTQLTVMICAMVLSAALWSSDPPAPPPSFSKTGPQVGDFLPRIRLTGVSDELGEWHPEASGLKLLVTSSYTCPKSRSHYPELRDLAQRYKDSVKVVIVYVIEAHPLGDISPYKGVEEVTPENRRDGILFRQPVTFPVRLGLAQSFKQRFDIEMPIYLDGMDNRAWKALGGAPNMGLLVDERERVVARQDWFDGPAMGANIEKALQDAKDRKLRIERDEAVQKNLGNVRDVTVTFRDGRLEEAKALLDAHPEAINIVYSSARFQYDYTPLQLAVEGGHADMATLLLDRGADINADTVRCGTPLQMAAQLDKGPMLDLLIGRGADVNRVGYDGRTALDHAALHEVSGAIERLLRAKALQSCFSAAATGNVQALRAILAKDASRAIRPDGEGMTPLDYAAATGHVEAARVLIEEFGADPGFTHVEIYKAPIHWAIERKHIEMVTYLLSAHADPRAEFWGGNGLHLAAANDCLPLIRLLLEAGVNPNLANGRAKLTPLHLAALNSSADILALLVDHGADMSAATGYDPNPCGFRDDPYHDSALHLAAMAGKLENVRLLIARKVDVNAVNSYHRTALNAAAMCRNEDQRVPMITALLSAGADINHEDRYGMTVKDCLLEANDAALVPMLDDHGAKTGSAVLKSAFDEGDLDRARALIAQGVNVNGINNKGNTVLHEFVQYRETKESSVAILEMLLKAGADMNRENYDGKTPRDVAVDNLQYREDHKSIVLDALISHGAKLGSGISQRPVEDDFPMNPPLP